MFSDTFSEVVALFSIHFGIQLNVLFQKTGTMEASSIMIKVLVLIQIFSSSLSETEVVESFTEADMGSQSMVSCSSTSPETYKAGKRVRH